MAIHLNPITTIQSDRYSASGTVRHFVEAALRGHNPNKSYNIGDILFLYDEATELFRFYSGRRNEITGEFDINDWKHLYDRTATDILIALLMRPCVLGPNGHLGGFGGDQGNTGGGGQSSLQQYFEPTADMETILEIFQGGSEGASTPSGSATMMNVFQQTDVSTTDELVQIMSSETNDYTQDELGEMFGEVCDTSEDSLIAYLRPPSSEGGALISF